VAKPKALYVLKDRNLIYSPAAQQRIGELVDVVAEPMRADEARASPELLREVEVLLSSWGGPRLDEDFLKKAPRLDVLFYGAGALGGIMTTAAWQRGVRAASAWQANAVPVAEFAFAGIVMALKRGLMAMRAARDPEASFDKGAVRGTYGATVGLVALGAVGRQLLHMLSMMDVEALVYDPHVTEAEARELGVEAVSLEALFARSDVVSLHAPWLPETEGMITGELMRSMKRGAALINTARGAVVREDELIAVLRERADLQAILDVTHPEPAAADSPLRSLPNVFLTPHLAGAMGLECHRLGDHMLAELERYVAGQPMQSEVTAETAAHSTHRPSQ